MKVSKVLMTSIAALGFATLASASTETFTTTGPVGGNGGAYTNSTAASLGYTNGGLLPFFSLTGDGVTCPIGNTCVLNSVTAALGTSLAQSFTVTNPTGLDQLIAINLQSVLSVKLITTGGPGLSSGFLSIFNSGAPITLCANDQYDISPAASGAPGCTTNNSPNIVNKPPNVAVAVGPTAQSTATFTGGPNTTFNSFVSSGTFDSISSDNAVVNAAILSAFSFGQVTIAYNYTATPNGTTPEPVSMILFGSGLLGVALLGRKRFAR